MFKNIYPAGNIHESLWYFYEKCFGEWKSDKVARWVEENDFSEPELEK